MCKFKIDRPHKIYHCEGIYFHHKEEEEKLHRDRGGKLGHEKIME